MMHTNAMPRCEASGMAFVCRSRNDASAVSVTCISVRVCQVFEGVDVPEAVSLISYRNDQCSIHLGETMNGSFTTGEEGIEYRRECRTPEQKQMLRTLPIVRVRE